MNPIIQDLTTAGNRAEPTVAGVWHWLVGARRVTRLPGRPAADLRGYRRGASGVATQHCVPPGGQEREIRPASGRVVVTWTTDEALSSRINPRVAHYTGQEEFALAIQGGLQARERGDDDAATHLLGKAVKLAAQSGNDEMTARLQKVVEIDDAATGTVHLKRGVSDVATMDLELESTTTKRAARRACGAGSGGLRVHGRDVCVPQRRSVRRRGVLLGLRHQDRC